MEVVSTALKDATLADARETKAKVELTASNIPDVLITGMSVAVSGEAAISDKDSVLGKTYDIDKIASLETDRFLLDGSYFLPVSTSDYTWWGDVLCDENGVWNTNPYLTITSGLGAPYTKYVTVIWGQEEYPLEWKIIIDGSTTISLTNDDENIVPINLYVNTLKIEIVKWSEGYRRPKIQSVDFGITKIYSDNEIINMTITEQCDYMGIEIPSNDCNITIDNIDNDFDLLNPSGYYTELTEGIPMIVKIGHITEDGIQYVQMGKFYLDEYKRNKSQITLNGTDIIRKIDKEMFYGHKPYIDDTIDTQSTDITKLISNLMTSIGLTTNDYILDDEFSKSGTLTQINVASNFGWSSATKPITGRELLKKIAICYGMNIWIDRDGKLRFDYFNNKDMTLPYKTGTEASPTDWHTISAKTTTGNEIKLEDCVDKPIVNKNEILNRIDYIPEVLVETSPIIINKILGDITTSPITYFNIGSLDEDTAELHRSFVLSERVQNIQTDFETGITLNVTFTLRDFLLEIDAVGNPFEDVNVAVAGEQLTIKDETKQTYYYATNTETNAYNLELRLQRIDTSDVLAILTILFDKNKKYIYEANWRQDITNNLGDIVKIENEYNIDKYMIITFQQYKYNGALSGTTKGVGD